MRGWRIFVGVAGFYPASTLIIQSSKHLRKNRQAFEESMLQHRSSKDQRTLCQDCTHPECTAEGCTTCKSCRAEDCSAKKHDAPCKNLLKPLHPLRFPSNLEEKRSFRCDACRYKCASSQCRRTMPRKRRKVCRGCVVIVLQSRPRSSRSKHMVPT